MPPRAEYGFQSLDAGGEGSNDTEPSDVLYRSTALSPNPQTLKPWPHKPKASGLGFRV